MKSGSLNLLEHSEPVQTCNGIALCTFFTPLTRDLLEKLTGSQVVKKFPILWNPKIPNLVFKCPPHAPIPNQINPIHAPIFLFLRDPS